MKKVEVLVATMHQNDFSIINEMNIQSDIVYANQCDYTSYQEMEFDGHTAKMISTNTRGVGKNRNLALMYATADICLFADDDVVYNDGYEKTICDFYEQHPDADVVVFNFLVSRNQSKPINIVKTTKKIKRKDLSYGTYAISVRRSVIDWHNIRFHHQFGGGTMYSCGEDSKFLNDCFNHKLTVYTCNSTIGVVNHKDSTWFNGYSEKYFLDKGILFYQLMRRLAVPALIYHGFKHRKTYAAFGAKKALRLMIKGARMAKKMD